MPADVWLPYDGKGRRCNRCHFDRKEGWQVLTLDGQQFICRHCSPQRRQVQEVPTPAKVETPARERGWMWGELLARFGSSCLMCGATEPLTKDHVIPRVRGGSSELHNLQPLCGPCNFAKKELYIDFRVQPPIWHDEGRLVVWTAEHTRLLRSGVDWRALRERLDGTREDAAAEAGAGDDSRRTLPGPRRAALPSGRHAPRASGGVGGT